DPAQAAARRDAAHGEDDLVDAAHRRGLDGAGTLDLARQDDLEATRAANRQRDLTEAEELACLSADPAVGLPEAEAAGPPGSDRGNVDHALGIDDELLPRDVEATDELDFDHVTGSYPVVRTRDDATDPGTDTPLKAGVGSHRRPTGAAYGNVRRALEGRR